MTMNHLGNSHVSWLLDQVREVVDLWKKDPALKGTDFDWSMRKLEQEFERISKCPCQEKRDD